MTHTLCGIYNDVSSPMIGDNRQLVTNEPVEFQKQLVENQDCRKITDHFRGIYRMYPQFNKKNWRMSTSVIGENRQLVTNEPVEFEK